MARGAHTGNYGTRRTGAEADDGGGGSAGAGAGAVFGMAAGRATGLAVMEMVAGDAAGTGAAVEVGAGPGTDGAAGTDAADAGAGTGSRAEGGETGLAGAADAGIPGVWRWMPSVGLGMSRVRISPRGTAGMSRRPCAVKRPLL